MLHIENGVYCVTNWQNRQFDSDISTERVRKHREKRSGNVSETPPDPETDSESELKDISVRAEEMLSLWKTLFPKKPQPKPATYREKIRKRLQDPDFRDNWRKALELSSKSITCQNESWFNFEFLVTNDRNYRKMLDQWMDWKDKQAVISGNSKPPPKPTYAEVY